MDVDLDGATWRKSTYSNGSGGECVEVADLPSGRAVRDSKHPEGPTLVFTKGGWQAFVQGIRAGELCAEPEPGQAAGICRESPGHNPMTALVGSSAERIHVLIRLADITLYLGDLSEAQRYGRSALDLSSTADANLRVRCHGIVAATEYFGGDIQAAAIRFRELAAEYALAEVAGLLWLRKRRSASSGTPVRLRQRPSAQACQSPEGCWRRPADSGAVRADGGIR